MPLATIPIITPLWIHVDFKAFNHLFPTLTPMIAETTRTSVIWECASNSSGLKIR